MQRSPMKRATTAMKRSTFLRKTNTRPVSSNSTKARPAPKAMKSRQRAVSSLERVYWDRLANEIGCITCHLAGRATSPFISIHHIDGRTKPGCHRLVLPLCAGCHQQGTGNDPTLIAVHPNRKRFETLYGQQAELKALCDAYLARSDERKTQ